MIKPDKLRHLLEKTISEFKTNPDKLILQFDNGTIHATGAQPHSFEYHYNLEVIVTDFPHHPDVLMVPAMEFVRADQWELLENPTKRGSIKFEIERNNNKTYDIYINIPLTEKVIVSEEGGNYTVKHGKEPKLTEPLPIKGLKIYLQDIPSRKDPELIWNETYE